jgi:hypothetical protein
MERVNNTKPNTPGLSSLAANQGVNTNNTTASKPVPVKPASKPTATAAPAKPLVKETKGAREAPKSYTSSSFKVGDKNYYVINDTSDMRKMIKWDEKGNIAQDSPVQVIGKNIAGGFILAAEEATPNITKYKFPYTQEKGINFSGLETDVAGTTPKMQSIHKGTFTDVSDVIDPRAASQLRGIYKRTGQL